MSPRTSRGDVWGAVPVAMSPWTSRVDVRGMGLQSPCPPGCLGRVSRGRGFSRHVLLDVWGDVRGEGFHAVAMSPRTSGGDVQGDGWQKGTRRNSRLLKTKKRRKTAKKKQRLFLTAKSADPLVKRVDPSCVPPFFRSGVQILQASKPQTEKEHVNENVNDNGHVSVNVNVNESVNVNKNVNEHEDVNMKRKRKRKRETKTYI